MRKKHLAMTGSLVMLLAASTSQAFEAPAVGINAGSFGPGLDISMPILPNRLNVRVNGNYLSQDYTLEDTDATYDAKVKLQTMGALLDFYPFKGRFRLSTGLYYNGNQLDLTATPNGQSSYTFNGQTYTSDEVGSATGKMTFNKAAPYIGLGFGNPVKKDGGFGFMSNLGVMYQGAAKVSLQGTGAAADPRLAADIEAERKKVEDEASKYRWYPVLSFGVSYGF